MKKKILITFLIIVVGIGLLYSAFNGLRWFVLSEPDIIQKVVSPDGEYVAYVFESNGGATSWFVYRLSILKNGKQPKRGDVGNTYINDYVFDVEWKDNDTLMVDNTTTINYKQETKVHGVEVIYKYYGD
ncbi:MAG: hypothetical protein II996_02240 [Oscillospiraceae bacterium]|nr:hypothetical protein [Oscillospiraceae bacterium]